MNIFLRCNFFESFASIGRVDLVLYNKIMITSPFYLTDIFFKCTLIINYKDLGRAVAGVRGGGGKGDAVPSPVLS